MTTPTTEPTLRERIDAAPMSPYQWLIVGLCVLLNCLDGFDVLAMAFTAAPVGEEFGLGGAEIGVLLSAGLVGMAVGSLALAPFADVVGRRPVILASLALASVGMFGGALSDSAWTLGASRVVTGLGVGGILACTNVIVSEYSSRRSRGLAIGLYTAGYGIGATVGGLVAASLVGELGWRAVFLTGGILSGAVLLVLALLLPESVDFLLTRRSSASVDRLSRIASRLRQPAMSADEVDAAAATRPVRGRPHPGRLLVGDLARPTVLVWIAFFTTMYGFYFVNSWTPQLLVEAGLSAEQGISGGIALALGGTVGSVLYGWVAGRVDPRLTLMVFTVAAAVTMVVFITTTALLTLALVIGLVVGALINGCIAGLYTITPAQYDVELRSTGMGWGIGIGRIGAILAPLVTGRLLDSGATPTVLYGVAAAVVVVAALALMAMGPVGRRQPVQ